GAWPGRGGRGCQEQGRERQVREVAGREVDGERAREQPGEEPTPPWPRGVVADERRGRGSDRGGEHALERREDGRQREPQAPEHERERRNPGSLDGREPVVPGKPRPPQVDGRVGSERK